MAADEKWYFTKEQLANTPSRKYGFDADKELSYRQQAANFIQDMGQRLVVSQLCINTAIVYMHRFYVFHSLSDFHRNAIAAAALFLAAKVEEQPRKLEHVIKVAHMCLHREQMQLDTRSEQYLEQAQDLVFNENVLLQTLGFDVAIDHPHTHVVRCCHLVKASKDLAQTSYFMASNSLHLTTMCLQYKPTVVACFCIHLACKWSNWEIPPSNEGKLWFWYVDRTVTSELLQQLTAEFLHIFDKCPSRLKRKIMSISANQSPSLSHPSLPNSPFDTEPRKVQSPALSSESGPTFQSNRPHHSEKPEEKKPPSSVPVRPPVDYREYREKKERERLEREKAAAAQGHPIDLNKHHSHHHKPVPGLGGVPSKHPVPPGAKVPPHHNHHHRPEMKLGQPPSQRHSGSGQPRDPNRPRVPREYNSSSGTSGGTMYSHGNSGHPTEDPAGETTANEHSVNRVETGLPQDQSLHNPPEKLSNNNHSIHRVGGVDSKHQVAEGKHQQPHDKRQYDPMRHKPPEHRKDQEKMYGKYGDPGRMERQRKPDSLEQRSEEVRKLIEKPLPPLKPRPEVQKEEYIANMLKQSHHPKYNQEKLQGNPVVVLNQMKMPLTGQSAFVKEKSPAMGTSGSTQAAPKPPTLQKSLPGQHAVHGSSQMLKDTIKNGNPQSSLSNLEDPKMEKRPRHEDQGVLQTAPGKHRSLFSPEKTTATRESHSQRSKSKQKMPPGGVVKVPKQEKAQDASLNLVSPFGSPPLVAQQDPSPSKRVPVDATSSHKRHRTSSASEPEQQPVKVKSEDMSGFEAMKMLGRIPELIQPIRDNPMPSNGRGTSVANDLKPPELIRPFEPEPAGSQASGPGQQQQQQSSTASREPLLNGFDQNVKQESSEVQVNVEKPDALPLEQFVMNSEYPSPLKSAQSISALLQEPLAPMSSLLQPCQSFGETIDQQPPKQEQPAPGHPQGFTVAVLSEVQSNVPVDPNPPAVPEQGALDTNVQTTPAVEEKKSEHHKSEKKKKKNKHKVRDKDKTKDRHKHKHRDKDKHKEKDKPDEPVATEPIKITISKDKLNLSAEPVVPIVTSAGIDKTRSPQSTGLKIKIPKERLKGTEGVTSSSVQPLVQAPLKIKIRTEGISRSSGDGFPIESRKRERDLTSSPTTSGPPTKKHSQGAYGQRPPERQNGRHYSSSGNNKVRGGGRGNRSYLMRAPPPPYASQAPYEGHYQQNRDQDPYNDRIPRNSHLFPHAAHQEYSRSAPDQFYFSSYPPMYNPAGFLYDTALYYQQFQPYAMFSTGNMIMTPDGAIDTSVPPPSLPVALRQQNSVEVSEPKTPPPLPSGPPPSSPPPPPPPE